MKISRKRLIEIIQQEVAEANEQPNPERDVTALGQFSTILKKTSADIRGVKGLDAKEMTEILNIFLDLIEFASKKPGASLLTQLSVIIAKKTGQGPK